MVCRQSICSCFLFSILYNIFYCVKSTSHDIYPLNNILRAWYSIVPFRHIFRAISSVVSYFPVYTERTCSATKQKADKGEIKMETFSSIPLVSTWATKGVYALSERSQETWSTATHPRIGPVNPLTLGLVMAKQGVKLVHCYDTKMRDSYHFIPIRMTIILKINRHFQQYQWI